MYADNIDLSFKACSIPELQRQMEKDLHRLTTWLAANKLTLNILKTEYMLTGSINSLGDNLNLMSVNAITLRHVKNTKPCLGVTIDEYLTRDLHLTNVIRKASSGIGILRRIKRFVNQYNLMNVYRSIGALFRLLLHCMGRHWINLAEKLQELQNRAAGIITSAPLNEQKKS